MSGSIRRRSIVLAVGVVAALLSISGRAADEPASPAPATEAPFNREMLKRDPGPSLWAYIGADLGYTNVSPTGVLRESKRDGIAWQLKGLLSRYWTDWVGDLGLGYQYHRASGDDQNNPVPGGKVSVKTRSGFVELSPRYRLDNHWQLGAVFHGFFGGDVGFDENYTRDTSSFSMDGGARLNWESAGTDWRWRWGAQVTHDLTLKNRNIWWYMADVQIGIPLTRGEYRDEPAPEPSPAPPPPPSRPKAPKFAEVTEAKGVKIYLGEAVLRFETAKADLRDTSREILTKVAKYLKASPTAWSKMRIEGHADKRGKLEYNMRLSKSRAARVRNELVKLGIPRKKLAVDGFGPTRPIDPAEDIEAYALNRRVELWLDGVTDADTLVRDLNELK
jgi:outer membrane protein OmpA-like peptidoglycan-associated protein